MARRNGGTPAARSRRSLREWGALLAAGCVVSLFTVVTGAAPAAADDNCTTVGPSAAPVPWAQQLLAPERAWSFTEGSGQTVAVLDSGVDANQPQLRGHVAAGYDAVKGSGPANTDCAGSGTQVAGAIAAQQAGASGIYGVAPGVTIVPVRVAGEPGQDVTAPVTSAVLARGINWAVGQRVDVLDISAAMAVNDPGVRSAIANAVSAGITVVAAVGDAGAASDGDPTPYPASDPDVIGVGAIAQGGTQWENSEHGSYVDLVAPGAAVPALQREQGLVNVEGSTALAAGFVSGAAALTRARWPQLSRAQISARLLGTATPAAGGQNGPEYGHGIVNPYGAVADDMVNQAPVPMSAFTPAGPSKAELAREEAWSHGRRLAILLTVIGLGLLLVVTVTAIGLPRARRREWRPAFAAPVPERVEPDEPGPPALLFEEPSPEPGRPRR
ncbi:MAG TPA: S8 family serine peptidase [Rugosimonospora sp.]